MQPEFLSGEASASPAVEPLLAGARRLSERGFGVGALAARNGLRTTTHANLPLGMLGAQDFVEVADYDPHLDRLLCIGMREPHPHAGLQALVIRAKKEVGGIVLLDVGEAPGALAGLPEARRGRTTLESALGVLEALRAFDRSAGPEHVAGNGAAAFAGRFLVATGRTPEEALVLALGRLGASA